MLRSTIAIKINVAPAEVGILYNVPEYIYSMIKITKMWYQFQNIIIKENPIFMSINLFYQS